MLLEKFCLCGCERGLLKNSYRFIYILVSYITVHIYRTGVSRQYTMVIVELQQQMKMCIEREMMMRDLVTQGNNTVQSRLV